jgi:hypothetical protein
MTIDQYWGITTSDIAKEGWHVDEHYAHMFLFNYLRFSPSYLLARKANTTGLSIAEKKGLPKDFDQVLKTYDLLGDVHDTVFRYWWQRNGHDVFGVPYEKPSAQIISVVEGKNKNLKSFQDELMKFLDQERQRKVEGSSLIVSIPIDHNPIQTLKLVKQYLQEYERLRQPNPEAIKPKLTLLGQRFNSNALMKGFGLLMFKAAFPEMEHWRLGVSAKLSDSYSPALDERAKRQTKDAIEAGDRILMGKITYRALDKYQKIAENAARGKFPCSDLVNMASFDWPVLNARYQKTVKWEDKEMERAQKKIKKIK